MSKICNLILLALMLVIVAFDQLTKVFFSQYENGEVFVINSWLSFFYTKNTGAAWNILSGHSYLLAMLGLGVITAMIFFRKNFKNFLQRASLALIASGIIGNTIDRIVHGYVIDFICVDLKFYQWPVFNIADSAIFCGVMILSFTFLRKVKEAK